MTDTQTLPVPSRLRASLANFARNLVYPGLDLHTRNRASLRRYRMTGARDVMDASSGSGYFSWLAYRSGARTRRKAWIAALRHHCGRSEHLWIYDFSAMCPLLEQTGFRAMRRCEFGDFGDPRVFISRRRWTLFLRRET